MSIRDALVYVLPENAPCNESTVRFGAALAEAFGAELTVLTVAREPVAPVSLYVPHSIDMSELQAKNLEAARAALARAGRLFEELGVGPLAAEQSPVPAESFDLVIDDARLRDITVLPGRGDKSRMERDLIEAVLFESGRPVVLVPDQAGMFGLDNVMVAWDFSRTAARAAADSLPFLKKARKVTIVTVTNEKKIEPRLDAIAFARHLARHGVEADLKSVSADGLDIGAALLREAGMAGAGLLVMGAYGHSRLREWILGGATRSVIDGAPLPVLMSH